MNNSEDLMNHTMDGPMIDRKIDISPRQHDKAADKARRLDEFYKKYKDNDTTGYRASVDEENSEVDIAYQILSESGKENPLYFKNWILEVIKRQNKTVQNEAAAISEIYTMINMDSRFQHIGDGIWGLADWYPPETKRRTSSKTATKA